MLYSAIYLYVKDMERAKLVSFESDLCSLSFLRGKYINRITLCNLELTGSLDFWLIVKEYHIFRDLNKIISLSCNVQFSLYIQKWGI